MAYAKLPAPGTELGPCAENCKHIDCAQTRQMAETECFICGEEIGYETAFQNDEEDGLVHLLCAIERAEAIRTSKPQGRLRGEE